MSLRSIVLFLAFCFPLLLLSQIDYLKETRLVYAVNKAEKGSSKVKAWINLSKYYETHNVFKADSIAKLVAPRLDSLSGVDQFKAMLFVANSLRKNGNYNDYYGLIQKFQNFQDDALERNDAFAKQINIGFLYANYLEDKKAQKALNLALDYAKKMKSFTALTEVYCHMAINKMLSNQKDAAITFTEESLKYARRSGHKRDLSKAFNCQAQIYDFFGQVELAVAKNLVAFQLASSINDLVYMSEFSREIGQKQLLIDNLKDAEFYLNKSFDFARQINDRRQMGLALANKAEISRRTKNFQVAIKLNEEAIESLEIVADQNGLGTVYNNLGQVYKDLDAYPLAVNQFNKALIYYEKSVNREKIADVYYNVATVFRKQKRLEKALNYLNKSLEIQLFFGGRSKVYFTYREMSEIHKALGNKSKALEYLEYYVTYSDQNSTVQASRKIAELSESYRSEQRDRLISKQADSLEKQIQEKELTETKLENVSLRNNIQTFLILSILILIIFASMVGISRFKQNTLRQKQKEAEMSQTLLRTQMNPHFIFNAMSVIQSYIYENDVKNSSKFLVHFSRLMRLILENSPKEFIPLETEIEILQKYLEIQKLRFEDRFEYVLDCPDSLIFDNAQIPPMITQPFIENAIEHGQLHSVPNGKIEIRIKKSGNMLHIEIIDNGIGRKGAERNKKSKDHNSLAMKITKERIENLNVKYKAEGTLTVDDLDKTAQTGTKVLILLPYRIETADSLQNKELI
ncbi:MAG: histidine kinase [Bacteroidetes bacterium]|nr:histidine kinase [Bacteroidota bacterium]